MEKRGQNSRQNKITENLIHKRNGILHNKNKKSQTTAVQRGVWCVKCRRAGAAAAGSTPPHLEPAWCSPCSTTSTPPFFHWPHNFISQPNYRRKKREESRKPRGALTYSLVASRSRVKGADTAAAAGQKKKKNPNGARRKLEILRGLRVRECPLPPGGRKDGPADLGQIWAGGPHLAACRLFSAGYILGLVKAPAIKHTLLPSRAQFLPPPALSPSASTRVHKLLGS